MRNEKNNLSHFPVVESKINLVPLRACREASPDQLARFDADTLREEYCSSLYDRFGTYEEVTRITKLDRRTAKKYVHNAPVKE